MITISYAEIKDAKTLGEIHAKSWQAAYRGIVPEEILINITPEKRQKYFEKALTEGWEEDAIIYKDNEAAGLICIGKCRDEDKSQEYGEVWGIYLSPEYWNEGLGQELMNWGLNELKKRSFKRATLWVLEENLRARRFYEAVGFNHDGTVKEITIGKPLKEFRYEIALKNYEVEVKEKV